jgi:hypothetical protein
MRIFSYHYSCPFLSTWNYVPDNPGIYIFKTAPLITGTQKLDIVTFVNV